jgi:RP/EB family microtubule-associated protein
LIKAKYQDNLEFMQWLKRYHELNSSGQDYDGPARRKGQDLYYIAGGSKVSALSTQPHKIS